MRGLRQLTNRGMTMVMALFVTFLLSTLSLAFVTLMMEDSSGSRSSALQIMAAEGAEWGVETSLSYMGRGGNWQAAFDPDRLIFFDLLDASQPNGEAHLAATAGDSGTIEVRIEAGSGEESAFRTLRIVNPTLPNEAALQLDNTTVARVTVEVRPVVVPLAAYGPGQAPQYLLNSRCEVYRTDQTDPVPVAVSQLEAQVRPEVETTALFQVQNLRSWDVQWGGIGNPNTADKIIIPREYTSAGSVKVTGTDPKDSTAPWSEQAGNLRFQDPNSSDMVFRGQLSVAELNNLDLGGNAVTAGNPDTFPGGVVFGSDFLPLPDSDRFLSKDSNGDGLVGNGTPPDSGSVTSNQEWGLLALSAADKNAPSTPYGDPVSGYYRVGKELVVEAHRRHPKTPQLSAPQPVSKQDYKPAIPEVEVTLKSGGFVEVNVWETNYGDGGYSSSDGSLNSAAQTEMGSDAGPLGQTFHVDQLKNGVLYIEGGQVVVRSELSSGEAVEFEGRLQIVAAEDAVRRGQIKQGSSPQTYANSREALYHPAAQEYQAWQETRLNLPSDDPDYIAPGDFKAPPYTAQQLRSAAQSGRIDADVSDLAGVSDDAPYWVPPRASVETEGNLVVASDIRKKDGATSMIGLTAENYLLLNDRTVNEKADPRTLELEAVLTSFEHSLQFDWDNSSKNRVPDAWRTTFSPGFDGKIVLRGSMLAPYSDVEGDQQGRGYPRQEFQHDEDLTRWSPPFQPRTLLSEYPNDQISIAWRIISFTDRTSKGVRLPEDG